MTAGELCNRTVYIIRANESVLDAARLMRKYHVGCLVVVEERGTDRVPIALVTDRDLVVKGMAEAPTCARRCAHEEYDESQWWTPRIVCRESSPSTTWWSGWPKSSPTSPTLSRASSNASQRRHNRGG